MKQPNENKALNLSEHKAETMGPKEKYSFVDYGITVEARSPEEAYRKLQEKIKK